MGLKKFEKDMNIIAALDDEPNDVGGLSAGQLKERFDQAGREIKEYINEDMIPALEAETAAASLGVRMPSSSGIEGPGTIQEAIDSLSAVAMNGGAVPSGGAAGQILAKSDAEDHRLKWIDADAEAFGSYPKEKILSAITKTLFGLGEDAVPDDVLAWIGKYNQHWWWRRITGGSYILFKNSISTYTGSASSTLTLLYSDSVSVSQEDGTITLVSPQSFTGSGEQTTSYIKGHYFSYDNGATIYFAEQDARIIITTSIQIPCAKCVSVYFEDNGPWEYVHASDRNAYPDRGTSDGYEYEYLGVPFENAVGAPKIAVGSYVGTGTYGVNNPNSLTFTFKPKLVLIAECFPTLISYCAIFQCYALGNDYVAAGYYPFRSTGGTLTPSSDHAKLTDDNTLSWYSANGVAEQMNDADAEMRYIAIG